MLNSSGKPPHSRQTGEGPFLLRRLKVDGMWGYKSIGIEFFEDVNILIGPNACGKTTLLNILRYILSGDLDRLFAINFEKIELEVRSHSSEDTRLFQAVRSTDKLTFRIDANTFQFDFSASEQWRVLRRHSRYLKEVPWASALEGFVSSVPAVWLPVNRRLPIPSDQDEWHPAQKRVIESVDERLRELMDALISYRLTLAERLSEKHREFQRGVLEINLYNENYDNLKEIPQPPPTEDERIQLERAFQATGIFDARIQRRIAEHFDATARSLDRILASVDRLKVGRAQEGGATIEDYLAIPRRIRTTKMVSLSEQLEKEERDLFESLSNFVSITSSFMAPKRVSVDPKGQLIVDSNEPSVGRLEPNMLSSGEKQILILLTQALISEDKPVIYVADEPELSLHVNWQEQLLESIRTLSRQVQIVVATHSPDIVGPYNEKVIKLSK